MFKNLLNRILPAQAAAAPAAVTAPPVAQSAVVMPNDDVAASDALIVEGNALEDGGDLAQAESRYRAAVAAAPGHARASLNLGIALAARGDEDGAVAAYERVLEIDPTHPYGNYNYARLAFLRKDLPRAEAMVAAALRAKPDFPQALVVQAEVLDALGRPQEAVEALQRALHLEPRDAGAWFNLGSLQQKLGRSQEAEDAARRAVEIEPGQAAALELLAVAVRSQGFAQESLAMLRQALARDPTSWVHRSMELMTMNFVDDIPVDELFRRHLEFGAEIERAIPVRFEHAPDTGDRARRLRVGYLSSDFKLHPVSMFLLPVLEGHDRTRVEVFCYSFAETSDIVTDRVRAQADHWREVSALADAELADLIHADGIDVLVDLMGHSGLPRPGVFCMRPAPVQVNWLGYLNTTGLTRMDFRITDARSDPPTQSQPFHTERLFLLPASQWCYRPLADAPIEATAPVERHGHVTFGSFNASFKITPSACRRWAEVMHRVPGSRLLIADVPFPRKRDAVLRNIEAAGIAADRIEFLPRVPLEEYMRRYNEVDLAFDTFPYGGGTTTFDALWMGVPVVAAIGETPVARSAASILTALGLEDWIAPSVDDFVEVAVARASDRAALLSVRRTLRPRLQDSLLTEMPRYVRDLEAAYRAMWIDRTS